MKNKKAQMEIIGLVVIVILISLGMLFLVQFSLKEKPDEKAFTREGLASSTISTLLKMTVDCGLEGKRALREVLGNCGENKLAAPSFQKSCDGRESCAFFQDTVRDLLDRTLGEWGKRYEFQAQLPRTEKELFDPPIMGEAGGCESRERDSSDPFPQPTESVGIIESSLYVCE